MADDGDAVGVGIVRGLVLAAWSWLVLAATLALLNGDRYRAMVVGPRPDPAVAARVGSPGYFDVLARILTFDLGDSVVLRPGASAWSIVGSRLGTTALLTAEAVVLAGLLAAVFVGLARSDHLEVGRVLGYVGVLPAFGWGVAWLALSRMGLVPSPTVADAGLVGVADGALVLAPVAGAFLGRAAVRSEDRSGWLLDGWFGVVWLVGALPVVEALLAIPGVGQLWVDALVQDDVPVFFAATIALALPVVLASVAREVGWSVVGAEPSGGTDLADVVRTDRLVQAGLAGFGALLVGGIVLAAVTSVPAGRVPPRSELVLARVADSLGAVAVTAFAGTVAASAVGLPLGVAARASSAAGHVVRVVDHAANVPVLLLVAVWLYVQQTTQDPLAWELTVGAIAGGAVAPLVLRRVERGRSPAVWASP